MSETPLKKHCTDGKIEEGGIGKLKVRKTSTEEGGNGVSDEKRKWPVLCDTNPYIVDFFKNVFKKKEPPPPEPEQPS